MATTITILNADEAAAQHKEMTTMIKEERALVLKRGGKSCECVEVDDERETVRSLIDET